MSAAAPRFMDAVTGEAVSLSGVVEEMFENFRQAVREGEAPALRMFALFSVDNMEVFVSKLDPVTQSRLAEALDRRRDRDADREGLRCKVKIPDLAGDYRTVDYVAAPEEARQIRRGHNPETSIGADPSLVVPTGGQDGASSMRLPAVVREVEGKRVLDCGEALQNIGGVFRGADGSWMDPLLAFQVGQTLWIEIDESPAGPSWSVPDNVRSGDDEAHPVRFKDGGTVKEIPRADLVAVPPWQCALACELIDLVPGKNRYDLVEVLVPRNPGPPLVLLRFKGEAVAESLNGGMAAGLTGGAEPARRAAAASSEAGRFPGDVSDALRQARDVATDGCGRSYLDAEDDQLKDDEESRL